MKFILTFLCIILLFSCQKDSLPQIESIQELTEDFNSELQYRSQLRLAFGNTVANAFADSRFSEYILKTSKRTNSNFYDEIVFALHKDDIVYDDKSLLDVLYDARNNEVIELFGSELFELILKDDPLVSIKLPDVFFDFNWDTDNYAPMVYVKTPRELDVKDPENTLNRFAAYHYSGFQELVNSYLSLSHFCVIVKYSETYLLVNKEEKINEKEIPFLSIVPQAINYWEETIDCISTKGKIVPDVSSDFYFINKRILNQLYLDLFEQENYYFQFDNPNCLAGCVIDCFQDISEARNVLSDVEFKDLNGLGDYSRYSDNIDLLFVMSNYNAPMENGYFSMGNRVSDIFDIVVNYNFKLETKDYKNLNCVSIPTVNIEIISDEMRGHPLIINYLYHTGVGIQAYAIEMRRLYYEDDVIELKMDVSSTIFSASRSWLYFVEPIYTCIINERKQSGTDVDPYFKM